MTVRKGLVKENCRVDNPLFTNQDGNSKGEESEESEGQVDGWLKMESNHMQPRTERTDVAGSFVLAVKVAVGRCREDGSTFPFPIIRTCVANSRVTETRQGLSLRLYVFTSLRAVNAQRR